MPNRYQNLSIRGKLICGFGLSGIVLAIIGCMAFTGMNRLSGQSESIYKTSVIPITMLSELRSTMLRRSNAVLWHIMARDGAAMAEQENKIAEHDQAIDELMRKYESVIVTESERKLFEQLKGGMPGYMEARKKLLGLSRDFRKDNAEEVQRVEVKEKLGVLNAAIDGLVANNNRQAQEQYQEGQVLSDSLNWTMLALSVAALLIGVWSVWFVSKSIVGNARSVLDAAQQLQGGNLAARATVTTQDEIGQLAASFNEMAKTVEQTAKLQEEAYRAQTTQSMELSGVMKAIGASQAAIEFNPDGTIISANENFLKVMGYSLQEIKGEHHRMFCDPTYVGSGDYVTFWQKLNRGVFEAGMFRRHGKGGKEVWIQASYNPIVNAQGKVQKIIKFAYDITPQKTAQAYLERCMGEAQVSLSALAKGDLTHPVRGAYEGELGIIKDSINQALSNLSQIISTVRESVQLVAEGSEEISRGNENLSQRTVHQASSLQETAASMEEMTSTVKQNADNSKQANVLAMAARESATKGGAITTRVVEAMGEITKSSKKISDIITVVDEIAFQTNLLALNAAVEAARAGEHGRGFAVVAAEVRNLAQRSATAAKEIKDLIGESLQSVTVGSGLVHESGKTLEEVVASVKRVADIIGEISAASQEQASGIEQINQAVLSMDDTTQQNAALVEETTSAAESMQHQARELAQLVKQFTVSSVQVPQIDQSARLLQLPQDAAKTIIKPSGRGGEDQQVHAKRAEPKMGYAVRGSTRAADPARAVVGTAKDHRSSGDGFDEF